MKDNATYRLGWLTLNLAFLFSFDAVVGGCAKALLMSNMPSQDKLRIIWSQGGQVYTITVAEKNSYAVPPDGRVTLEYRGLGFG
jgi:hypothetical protein